MSAGSKTPAPGERSSQRVPVASLASREQGVEAVGAVQPEGDVQLRACDQGTGREYFIKMGPRAEMQAEADRQNGKGRDYFVIPPAQPKAPAPVPVVQGEAVALSVQWPNGYVDLMWSDEFNPDYNEQRGGEPTITELMPRAVPGGPVAQGEGSDLEWQRLPEIRGKFLDYAKEPTDANALRIIRACADRFTPLMAVGAVGGVGAKCQGTLTECPTCKNQLNKCVLFATPAPEQATTGSGQDSGSVHLGSGDRGEVHAPEPRKSLNAKVADLLRPFLKEGQKVIWREAFRWHDDNGVLSNHYDGMSLPRLAEEFGYEWEFDFHLNHAAIVSTASPAGEGEGKP